MKITFKKALISLLAIPMLAFGFSALVPASGVSAADDLTIGGGASAAKSDEAPAELFGDGGIFQTITNVILYVLGAVSVLMLIYGGSRYTISGGDSAQVTAAKNTIMYAIVGVIVALLAYAIINFVIGELVG